MSNPVQEFRRYYIDNNGVDPQDYVAVGNAVYPDMPSAVLANNHVLGFNSDGTYVIRYEWRGGVVDADNPGFWNEWKYERSQNGTQRVTSYRSGDGFNQTLPPFEVVPFSGGNDPTEIFVSVDMPIKNYCQKVLENSNRDIFQEKLPGNWAIRRLVTGPGFTETEPTIIQAIEFRMLAIRNFDVEDAIVDPHSDQPMTKFRAEIYLLPPNWLPYDEVPALRYTGWDLDVFDAGGNQSLAVSQVIHPVSHLGNGKVANVAYDWDGRYSIYGQTLSDNEPLEGRFRAVLRAGTRAEVMPGGPPHIIFGASDRAEPVDFSLTGCACKCKVKAGSNFLVFDLMTGMVQSALGPALEVSVTYCSNKKDRQPQSMGFGWSGPSTARVLEPAGQNGALVYRDEGGSHLRWEFQNGNYVPTSASNYLKIQKTSDPQATYVVTFPNQSRREFRADGLLTRSVDRLGLSLTYQYTNNVLASMTDATGQILQFAFRPDGQLASLSSGGRQTTLTYDTNGRLHQVTDPANQITTYLYNAEGLLEKIRDTRNQDALTLTYNALGQEISRQVYDQVKTTHFYEEDDADLQQIEYDFSVDLPSYVSVRPNEPAYGCPRTVDVIEDLTGASPTQIKVFHFDRHGNLACSDEWAVPEISSEEPAVFNRTIREFNDPNSRHLVTRLIQPNLSQSIWEYDEDANVKKSVDDQGNGTEFYYAQDLDVPLNPLHKNLLRKIVRPGSSLANPSLEMTYDPNGNLIRVYDEKRYFTEYQVNSQGLPESVTDRRGHITSMTYHATSRRLLTITSPTDSRDPNSGRTVTFDYDLFGNVRSVKDNLDHEILYEFDAVDRVTKITDARGVSFQMQYLDGLLDQVVAPPNAGSATLTRTSRLSYDNSGRLILSESEVAPSTFQSRVGYEYTGYSQLKQLKRWKDATEKHAEYAYDLLGRLVSSKDFAGREDTVAYAPFCGENTVTTARGVLRKSSYNNLCQLERVQVNDETKRFWYDERGRLIKAAAGPSYANSNQPPQEGGLQPGYFQVDHYAIFTQYQYDERDLLTEIESKDGEIRYAYDEEENLIEVIDSFNRVTQFSYLNDGRLYQVAHQGQVFTYEYDAVGRLLRIHYPPSTGMVASFTKPDQSSGWDENGQLLCLRYLKNGNHFHRFEYTLDDSGNRISQIDTPENLAAQVTWSYGYDWLNRLTSVSKNGQTTSLYAYDESDNRVQLSLPQANEVWAYTYDVADRILSRSLDLGSGPNLYETFQHDDDGNLTERTLVSTNDTKVYRWDADNRLRDITHDVQWMTAQYEFTGIRRQAYQNGDPQSSRYHTSGGLPLNENARDGTDVSFIQGHQILGLYDGTDFFYHISDGLSSVRVLIDATGSAVAHFTTNEFGIPEPPTGPRADLDFMTYQGSLGVRNDSSGLYYARHRYYDPALGRWLSADPIGFEGGLNLYAGMGNNPTTYVDPEGLEYGPKEFTVDFGFMVLGFGFAMLDGPEPGPADCFAYAQAGPSAARVSAKALDIALEQRRAIGAAIAGIPFLHITLAKMFDGSGSGDNSVYIGNKGGRDCYVGITKNLAKRQAQHGPRFKIEELIGELTRNQARAIEQSLIESARALGRNYHNLRNSISPTRAKEFYKGAKAWAEEYLKKNKIGLPPR